jgi:predicted alpha/beta-fold hydrolase
MEGGAERRTPRSSLRSLKNIFSQTFKGLLMTTFTFCPLPGLSSPHLQTIVGAFRRAGKPPPSYPLLVPLEDGDCLSCEVSTPPIWKEDEKTICLVHGLGGSHTSRYMIRISRKLYLHGHRVVRINLRGCGSGKGLSKLPYHGGTSHDILAVLKALKQKTPVSPLHVVGFSLGGNIVLKLAGELESRASLFAESFIAICPPIDLKESVRLIERYPLYQSYYLKRLQEQAAGWLKKKVSSLYEFDDTITAPLWGYSGADAYYKNASALQFLPHSKQKCLLLFAKDDPFINVGPLFEQALPQNVEIVTTSHGGHMGFVGKTALSHRFFWLDQLLLNWV